ncbi:hypothetical protein AaE_009353 [Aphanomyces astaci]|uniref:ATP-dependent DNA helicase n=1 Tax=Aphanomyces astaci TaxID=112090 RepID=A0A6A5A3G4_APHAT|nr:hypothetical protein AaE_009353 [Aphanomyces astaci]
MGSSLQSFVDANKLPPIPDTFVGEVVLDPNPFVADEMRFLAREKTKLDAIRGRLHSGTHEHKSFFDRVMVALERPEEGRLFFLEGEGGSGKTYISQIILAEVRLRGEIALAVASSGLAALLLMGGRTAHNRFGIPTNQPASSTMSCTYNVRSNQCALLKKAVLIIWDEISMMHRYYIEAVDRMLQDIMQNDRPFGGKVVIFSGDYKQLLPVLQHKTLLDAVHATLPFSRQLWPLIENNKIKLTINMRLRSRGLSDQDKHDVASFARFILSIGHGTAPTVQGRVRLPDSISTLYDGPHSVRELIQTIYGRLNDPLGYRLWTTRQKQDFFAERAILAPKNADIARLNSTILSMIPGEAVIYRSADSVVEDGTVLEAEHTALNFPVEFLNTVDVSGFPKHELCLKVGAPVMLLRNLSTATGLCNGKP